MVQGTIDDIPGAIYAQDQAGNDFTDYLTVTGTSPGVPTDVNVIAAGAIFRNNFDDVPAGDPTDLIEYITAVYAMNSAGSMISQSWEFGGFNLDPLNPGGSDADRQLLVELYLSALGPPPERFIRGDANSDGSVDMDDAVDLFEYLFPLGSPPNGPTCLDAADSNADAKVNIADVVSLLSSLFGNPTTIPLPAPNSTTGCGIAPLLGCATNTPPC